MATIQTYRTSAERLFPYLLFLVSVSVYSYFHLGDGYCVASDEGYLQSLASRVLGGEAPYRDFYFLRTPLSIYMQAFFMLILGESHTIMAARIIWLVQSVALVVLLSFLYKDILNRIELTFILFLSFIITTLLLSFPWYSYDSIFFITIAAVCIRWRRFYVSGLFVFLAFMSKQNYLLFLPLLFMVTLGLTMLDRNLKLIDARQSRNLILGFGTGCVGYGIFLLTTGNLGNFIENVFVLPRQCNSLSLSFALFQDNLSAFKTSLPFLIAIGALFYLDRKTWPLVLIPLPIFFFMGHDLLKAQNFIFTIIYINYTILLLFALRMITTKTMRKTIGFNKLILLLAMAAIVQYLAGFNYDGLFFAYQGAGFFVPLTYILFRDYSPSSYRRPMAVLLIVAIAVLGFYHKHKFIYHDNMRPQLIEEYKHQKLAGIRSTPKNVDAFRELTEVIERYSKRDDYLFIFPDHPAIYYLTDRKNPTRIEWYYWREYNERMLMESIEALQSKKPKLVLINPDRTSPAIRQFFEDNYEKLQDVDVMDAYIPPQT